MTNGTRRRPWSANFGQLIAIVQREFPSAGIRITGRARTIRRQGELMAQRIRANRQEFLGTYRPVQHIIEMDQWYRANRAGTLQQTVNEFEAIINRARVRGALVSNHLSNTARDIGWPIGNTQQLNTMESRIRALGASVIREPKASGGRHWHVDW